MKHTGWEDFPVGRTIRTGAVTVTEAHVVGWAGLTGDWYPLHVDAEYASRTPFGERVAHGPLTFGLAVGLVAQTGEYGDAIVAWLGADDVRASQPVLIGDTISVTATVTDARPTKTAGRRVVTLDYRVTNQRDEEVMRCRFTVLMSTREPAGRNG